MSAFRNIKRAFFLLLFLCSGYVHREFRPSKQNHHHHHYRPYKRRRRLIRTQTFDTTTINFYLKQLELQTRHWSGKFKIAMMKISFPYRILKNVSHIIAKAFEDILLTGFLKEMKLNGV